MEHRAQFMWLSFAAEQLTGTMLFPAWLEMGMI